MCRRRQAAVITGPRGVAWFRSLGVQPDPKNPRDIGSLGPKLYNLSGHINKPGTLELLRQRYPLAIPVSARTGQGLSRLSADARATGSTSLGSRPSDSAAAP